MRTIVRIHAVDLKPVLVGSPSEIPGRKENSRRPARSLPLSGLLLTGGLMLTACGEMPAARTNCWTTATSGGADVSQAAIRPGMLAASEPVDPSTCD
jgi:hypothetical protein